MLLKTHRFESLLENHFRMCLIQTLVSEFFHSTWKIEQQFLRWICSVFWTHLFNLEPKTSQLSSHSESKKNPVFVRLSVQYLFENLHSIMESDEWNLVERWTFTWTMACRTREDFWSEEKFEPIPKWSAINLRQSEEKILCKLFPFDLNALLCTTVRYLRQNSTHQRRISSNVASIAISLSFSLFNEQCLDSIYLWKMFEALYSFEYSSPSLSLDSRRIFSPRSAKCRLHFVHCLVNHASYNLPLTKTLFYASDHRPLSSDGSFSQ